ncbi:MAG TPA: hypothetical protein VHC86_10885 [Opitutaceae bacterium]|nr:hypothetical protein [Opitutaceae bacterium]
MPAAALHTEAWVLARRPPAESFQGHALFSAEHGLLQVFVRVPKSGASKRAVLDLFTEAAVDLESSNQGRTWFLREARVLRSAEGIGRSYDALQAASSLAALIARNPPPPEGAAKIAELLRGAFAAFGASAHPAVVLFKSVYRFARDEGYPVPQEWLPSLPADLRAEAERLLRTPLAELADPAAGALPSLQRRLEDYLKGRTDILVD